MPQTEWSGRAAEALRRIRERRPLVHQITNLVVMNPSANTTLAVGASPVMAHAHQEVADMVGLAGALVLNTGTLEPDWIESMLQAGRRANELGIPVILDPVGAGATSYRTETDLMLLSELTIAALRGNAGEIGALTGAGGAVRGVDSVEGVADPLRVAAEGARRWSTAVAITGARDVLSDGTRALAVDNGHPYLTVVTGTGCSATAMIGAFAAVEDDHLVAAASALAVFGLAAEQAAEKSRGPGTFQAALFDALYHLTPEEVEAGVRIVSLPLD
jgi:hydroxyethylthiazole kinase